MDIYIFIQLLIAVLLGSLIGIEREYKHKPAGMKTYALVALGSAVFMILGKVFTDFVGPTISYDPSRLLSSIIVGVGFIGGGIIVKREYEVEGLSTAAGLWIAAAIGAAVGLELYMWATFATVLVLFVFYGITYFENRFIRKI